MIKLDDYLTPERQVRYEFTGDVMSAVRLAAMYGDPLVSMETQQIDENRIQTETFFIITLSVVGPTINDFGPENIENLKNSERTVFLFDYQQQEDMTEQQQADVNRVKGLLSEAGIPYFNNFEDVKAYIDARLEEEE